MDYVGDQDRNALLSIAQLKNENADIVSITNLIPSLAFVASSVNNINNLTDFVTKMDFVIYE